MGTPKITLKMTPSCIFVLRLLIFPGICVFAFIDFRGPRDFINGGGLLIQGGDYIYIYIQREIDDISYNIYIICKYNITDVYI